MEPQDSNQPDPVTHITGQNRRAWNEIAEVRSRVFPPAEFFAQGNSTLDVRTVDVVRAAFDRLDGLTLIHLQCATGEDTLSWAVLGARAYGVDIADQQIEIARKKAAAAGLAAQFFAADIYALPAALPAGWPTGQYDVVFTGGGAIVWLPDLQRWAKIAAALLRPGGRLVLSEEHPLSNCLDTNEGNLQVVDDYFRRGRPWEGHTWAHFSGGETATENKYEFNWPLGDIITALAQAGLIIERLEEFPGGPEWRFGSTESEQGEMAHLPGEYLIVARKPGG